ncbi:hypothetical protein CRUP_022218, partial [Coryphaenoides rupestris]
MVLIRAAIKSVFKYLNRTREEDSWSVHYITQKSQRSRFFLPGSKPFSSVDDVRAEVITPQDGTHVSRIGYGSCQIHPQNPASQTGSNQSQSRKQNRRRKSSAVSEEEQLFFYSPRPLTPPVNTADITSCDDIAGSQSCEGDLPLPLPTPEERMRQHAQAVPVAIVPINITGESFVRQATSRRGQVADSSSPGQQPHQSMRRKTVSGIPDDITKKMDRGPVYGVLPGQYSTEGRPGPATLSQTPPTSRRRIRAQKGEGICSLMASLTSSPTTSSCLPLTRSPSSSSSSSSSCLPNPNTSSPSPSSGLLHLPTSSSSGPDLERCRSTSCRRLHSSSSTSSCSSQGFHGDLQPLQLGGSNHPCSALFPRGTSSSSSLSGWESPVASGLQENHSPATSSSSTQKTSFVPGESWAHPPPSPGWSSSLPQETGSVSRDRLLSDCSEGSVSSRRGPNTISLRKALRPPIPPRRSDSLATPPRDPLEPNLHNPTSHPDDPWVPRLPARRGSEVASGMLMTFDPAGLPRLTRDSRDALDPEFPHLELMSLGSRELDLCPLGSPSSGYSSQSNTPLSSPFYPSSPFSSSSSSPLSALCSSRAHPDCPPAGGGGGG